MMAASGGGKRVPRDLTLHSLFFDNECTFDINVVLLSPIKK